MLIYRGLFLGVGIIDLLLAVKSFTRKKRCGKSMAYTLFFAMLTTIAYLFSICTESYLLSSVFSSIYFACIDWILIWLLIFVIDFTRPRRKRFITKKLLRLMIGYAVVDAVAFMLNPWLEFVASYREMLVMGFTVYKFIPHLWFNLHLGFCYTLIGISIGYLVEKTVQVPKVYRSRYLVVVGSVLSVVAMNLLYLLGQKNFELDISVLFYSAAGFLLYISVFSVSERNLVSTMRNLLLEHIGWGIAFFDYEDGLTDCNENMLEIFPELRGNFDYTDLVGFVRKHRMPELTDADKDFEWKHNVNEEEHIYRCEFKCMKSEQNSIIGKMLVFHDITYMKDVTTGLDLISGLHRYYNGLSPEIQKQISVLTVNVNGMAFINDAMGYEKGSQVILRVVELMRRVLPIDTFLARLEDGTLIALMTQSEGEENYMLANRVQQEAAQDVSFPFRYEVEYGLAQCREGAALTDLMQEAMESMKSKKLLSQSSNRSSLINSLTQTLLESDYETEAHVMRTKAAAMDLGLQMGLTDKELAKLALLSTLHDIGKIAIPSEILLKPGKLTEEEWVIMKTHADKGYRIAKASPELESIAELILHHHERWDGRGYPDGLKQDDIPLLSRIITVVDSFDVMIHDRPYHKAISEEEARAELLRCSGTQFDPAIVKAYIRMMDRRKHG